MSVQILIPDSIVQAIRLPEDRISHELLIELSGVDFISVDDKLIKKCQKSEFKIWTGSPIAFCEKEDLQ